MRSKEATLAEGFEQNRILRQQAKELLVKQARRAMRLNPELTRAELARQFGCSESRLEHVLEEAS
jgi:AraC-like DNA-binding protein